MSYNPNQDPNSGYGNPPYGIPPSGPYGQPQNPYGAPTPGPYGQPPSPYGAPPQGPYGQPPSPYGYGPPPQGPYGAPVYQQPGYGYGPPPIQTAPLPLAEAIRQLPQQYIRILTRPSAATFAEEQGKAAWNIVWVQLLGLGVISGLLVFLILQIALPIVMNSASSSGSSTMAGVVAIIEGFAVGFAILEIIAVPVSFFITSGIYYLIAKAFSGQGTFLAQSYSATLFYVPMAILSLVLGLIPFLGGLAGLALFVYEIVLGVYMMMAVHRIGGGKATVVVLLPAIVLFLLLCVLGIIIAAAVGSH